MLIAESTVKARCIESKYVLYDRMHRSCYSVFAYHISIRMLFLLFHYRPKMHISCATLLEIEDEAKRTTPMHCLTCRACDACHPQGSLCDLHMHAWFKAFAHLRALVEIFWASWWKQENQSCIMLFDAALLIHMNLTIDDYVNLLHIHFNSM